MTTHDDPAIDQTNDPVSNDQGDHTAKDAATETPRHYTPGTVKPKLGGRDVPKTGQFGTEDQEKLDNPETEPPPAGEEPPPPPAGMKPNDLVAMPPGSVKAPSSFPGGTPATDVVVPEKDEAAENDENKDDE